MSEPALGRSASAVALFRLCDYSHIRMEAKRKAIGGLTSVAAVDSEVVAAGTGQPRVN